MAKKIINQYLVDEKGQKLAVQINIDTFNSLINVLESCKLAKLMLECDEKYFVDIERARKLLKGT